MLITIDMIKYIEKAVLILGLVSIASCTNITPLDLDDAPQSELLQRDKKKWAEEDEALAKNKAEAEAIAKKNEELRQAYLEDLRAYKKSDHQIMFGWFAYWDPYNPDKTFSLDLLPDSVDFVSNWGKAFFGDSKLYQEQLDGLKEKGTRMTIGWIIENVGSGFRDMTAKDWPDDPHEAIDKYVEKLVSEINKYGYDGFDIDYEPTYASPFKPGNHCGDGWSEDWTIYKPLIGCDKGHQEYENYFFKKLREALPKGEKLLNINGSIGFLSPEAYKYFDYFVFQSYNNSAGNWVRTMNDMVNNHGVKKSQFIFTETFQSNPGNADRFVNNYAKFAKENNVGGIGAFHINEDWLHGPKYKNVKAAIQYMNPAFSE